MKNNFKINDVKICNCEGLSCETFEYMQVNINGEIYDSDNFGTLEEFFQYIIDMGFAQGQRN